MCSEKTVNLDLPHYLPSDHPDFLCEINDAYEKLDSTIKELQVQTENLYDTFKNLTTRIEQLENAVGGVYNDRA